MQNDFQKNWHTQKCVRQNGEKFPYKFAHFSYYYINLHVHSLYLYIFNNNTYLKYVDQFKCWKIAIFINCIVLNLPTDHLKRFVHNFHPFFHFFMFIFSLIVYNILFCICVKFCISEEGTDHGPDKYVVRIYVRIIFT